MQLAIHSAFRKRSEGRGNSIPIPRIVHQIVEVLQVIGSHMDDLFGLQTQ
jgi:hypothetical protein